MWDVGPGGVHDVETGFVSSRLWPLTEARVPACLELRGDCLYYAWDHAGVSVFDAPEADTNLALDAFVAIEDSVGVLRFAKRYGILGLCGHGLPATHHRGPGWCPPCGAAITADGWNTSALWEPIERWLLYVRQMAAVVRLASALCLGELGTDTDWATVSEGRPTPRRDPRERRHVLAAVVNGLVHLAGVRPELEWGRESERASLRLIGGGTFGALATQLMLAASQAHGIAVCSGCGRFYLRRVRAPQRGRGNFCANCVSTGVPAKLRKRNQRTRQRGAAE